MGDIKVTILIVLGIAGVIGLSIGLWHVQRKINYSVSYESMVQDTVRDMVKKEALK